MPYVLYPDICAGGEEQPLLGDEQEADDVWCERDTHKEHRERLWDKTRRVEMIDLTSVEHVTQRHQDWFTKDQEDSQPLVA